MARENAYRQELIAKRAENEKQLCNYILGRGATGATVKEMSEDLGWKADTIRSYVEDLLGNGYMTRKRAPGRGKTYRYFWSHGDVPETKEETVMPEHEGGVEIDPGTQRNCSSFCKQGDVVYCSSRSGDGEFFRYLVLVPWARKATVACIFPEGHPSVDLNNPEMIYIGDDPESGLKLYADITNLCQRGYKTFGEKLMHIEKDRIDAVKNRLSRVMCIECAKSVEDSAAIKLKAELARSEKQLSILIRASDKATEKMEALQADYIALNNQADQYKQLMEEAQEMCKTYAAENQKLLDENAQLRQEIMDVEASKTEEPEYDPEYVDKLERNYGEALLKIKELETRAKCNSDQIEFMRQVIFKTINKGGN